MDVNTTYEPYAREEEYIAVNRAMIESLDLDAVRSVVDLACGTGLLSDLLFARKKELSIAGIDLSGEQIDIARRSFADRRTPLLDLDQWHEQATGICLMTGSADTLPVGDGAADLALMGNAIHLMPDRLRFLSEVARVLRPGGVFVFNSVFFVGTFPNGSGHVFTEWIKDAVLVLEERNSALVAAGQPRIRAVRGRGDRAFSKNWLSVDGWCELLESSGFAIAGTAMREVAVSRRGLALAGAYGGLAEVLMSGYPVEVASECLQEAAGRTFDRLGIESVPRLWLEVAACKR